MAADTGKFTVSYADLSVASQAFEKDTVYIGRLEKCEITLDHASVSRIHAAINYKDKRYSIANISNSNILTLNGRLLGPKREDILASGDIIQIGPFTILTATLNDELLLIVEQKFVKSFPDLKKVHETEEPTGAADGGVLDVFWEKRSREKEDWGTRLRPTEKPLPGKAMINWKPTGDLRKPWQIGLFVWAFLLIGAIAVVAFYRYPQAYAPEPLSNPHTQNLNENGVAVTANANSCTTCHTPNQPIENACIKCHTAEQFHASNTKAHQEAGITCTVCHNEHKGTDFSPNASALASCAQCHNDNNKQNYNGMTVRTAHRGSYGYPVENGVWKWKGVYREVAELIPEINSPATGDKDEQAKLSRHFHSVHVARLKSPDGMAGDKFGLVSCSTCHKTFTPIDRVTPRETCAACHTAGPQSASKDTRFAAGSVNCISCHVQHAYSGTRWAEFLSDESLKRRNDAVGTQIKRLENK